MNAFRLASLAALTALVAACSNTGTATGANTAAPPQPAAAPVASAPAARAVPGPVAKAAAPGAPRTVKSRDGRYEGQMTGTPGPNAKFARLQIGMSMGETQNVLDRAPDRLHTYESGKRWIPFYFGSDATRMQVLYRGEGCLIFTGGNVWGGGGGELMEIAFDPSGACYQP